MGILGLARADRAALTNFMLIFEGLNLVCGPQHDYDINWKLAMFNTIDNQTCPRKAQGILCIVSFFNRTVQKW